MPMNFNIKSAGESSFARLAEIWEAAVRATHHFLPEEKIVFYCERIPGYFRRVDSLELVEADGRILGFIGTNRPTAGHHAKIEMLFVDPAYHGRGVGKALLHHVISNHRSVDADVNEQNSGAVAFYKQCAFHVIGRSACDSLGDPFPLLHLTHAAPVVETIEIREEEPRDFDAVRILLREAFERHPYSNGKEYRLVELLREQKGLALALVAECRREILGHIAFSPVRIGGVDDAWFALGPVAVRREEQRQGIGSSLIRKGLDILKQRHAAGCVLVGDPTYYSRFGFSSHEHLTVEAVPGEYVLQLSFRDTPSVGQVAFHPAFGVCSH